MLKRICKWKNRNNEVQYKGNVYYLEIVNGSDSNSGLGTDKPFLTKAYAESIMNNGDVLLISNSDLGKIPTAEKSAFICHKLNDTITDNLTPTSMVSSITKSGITWTFDTNYEAGQFCTGDYFVIDPGSGVTIISITPESTNDADRIANGSMINPDPTYNYQGYDNQVTMPYSSALNVAYDVDVGNPLVLNSGESLISTISVETGYLSPIVDYAEILTCLSSVPLYESFRPPYCGSDKSCNWQKYSLNYNIFRNVTPVGTPPNIASYADNFARPWLEHCINSQSGDIHPVQNMEDYGRDMSRQVGIGALLLNCDYTNAQKEALFIGMVQLGIDYYGCIEAGASWDPDGGIHAGKKFPFMLAAIALNDSNMQAYFAKTGDYLYSNSYYEGNEPSDYLSFQEDSSTFEVTQRDVDRSVGYTSGHLTMPEWGIRHSTTPASDDPDWAASYRLGSTVRAWVGWALAVMMMEGTCSMKTLWNHDVLFDYVDRHEKIAYGEDDGWTVPNEATGELCWDPAFVQYMWDTYRDSY